MPALIAVVGVVSLLNRVNQEALPRAASNHPSLFLSWALTMTDAESTRISDSIDLQKHFSESVYEAPGFSHKPSISESNYGADWRPRHLMDTSAIPPSWRRAQNPDGGKAGAAGRFALLGPAAATARVCDYGPA